jgi:hypothetical protein
MRDGTQSCELQYAPSKTTPSDPSRSRFGVLTIEWPYNPLNCGACSSAMMIKTFGFVLWLIGFFHVMFR